MKWEQCSKNELYSYLPTVFDSSLMLLQPNKPVLADAIWALTMESSDVSFSQGNLQFVLDGGALIYQTPWPWWSTYRNICALYCNYVDQKYGQTIIVFDGYTRTSTKRMSQQRRAGGGKVGVTVTFTDDMKLTMKKDYFWQTKAKNSPSLICLFVIFSRPIAKSTTRQLMLMRS